MRKIGFVFLVCLGIWTAAQADDLPLLGVGSKIVVASGGGTTTYDPANHGAEIALSGGNLVATGVGAGTPGIYDIARSITSNSTGKHCFETTINLDPGSSNDNQGISNSNMPVTGAGPGFDGTNKDLAIYTGTNGIFYNSGSIGSLNATPATGDILIQCYDRPNNLYWVNDIVAGTTPGTWNGTATVTPAAGTGGISISTLTGALFAYFGCDQAQASCKGTANFGPASSYAITAAGRGSDITGFGLQ